MSIEPDVVNVLSVSVTVEKALCRCPNCYSGRSAVSNFEAAVLAVPRKPSDDTTATSGNASRWRRAIAETGTIARCRC